MRTLIIWVLLVASSVVCAADKPVPRVVQAAEARREATVANARKAYLQTVLAAERQCAQDLQGAATAAGKAGNTDLFLAIAEAKKAAEARYEQAKTELDGPRLTILQALWGTEGSTLDVTAAITKAMAANQTLLVDNHDMGGDPAPGKPKVLSVRYRTAGQPGEATFHTGQRIRLVGDALEAITE